MLLSIAFQIIVVLVGFAWSFEKDLPLEQYREAQEAAHSALADPRTQEFNGNSDLVAGDESKRATGAQWNKLQGAWGKRADNWNRLNAVWGKRPERGWNNLSGMWGKRADQWNNLSGMWGKRGWNDLSGAYGKRESPHWNNLRGMWGKRSVDSQV